MIIWEVRVLLDQCQEALLELDLVIAYRALVAEGSFQVVKDLKDRQPRTFYFRWRPTTGESGPVDALAEA